MERFAVSTNGDVDETGKTARKDRCRNAHMSRNGCAGGKSEVRRVAETGRL